MRQSVVEKARRQQDWKALTVTVLLLDLGNTALKWAPLGDDEEPRTFVHCGADALPEKIFNEWLACAPERVIGCMVSSENLALTLTKFFNQHRISWEWMHSQPLFKGPFTLRNGYDDFNQLGSDRWYAAIGAASLYPGRALVVVHIGTATTVDAVLPGADGLEFKGGRILPGPAMMYRSLVKNTRCRPGGIGSPAEFPSNTTDAISSGILEAHLGVIDRAMASVRRAGFEGKLIFAGGAAPLLAPYIEREFPGSVLKHNLVLRGLAMFAAHS